MSPALSLGRACEIAQHDMAEDNQKAPRVAQQAAGGLFERLDEI